MNHSKSSRAATAQLSIGSALLIEVKVPWGFELENFVSKVIRYCRRKGIRNDTGRVQREVHVGERVVYATLSSAKPDKSGKFICNSASNYKAVCLIDKLLEGPALLHGLIGTLFRFCERPIALRADIESVLRQVQFPEKDRLCLWFLWHPRTIEPRSNTRISVSRIRRQNFPNCASYAIKRLGIDKEELYPMAAKAIQINFYRDDFIKSVGTSGEAIDIFSCKIFFRSFALNWKSG